jgi:ELWxxDGT repeat protein
MPDTPMPASAGKLPALLLAILVALFPLAALAGPPARTAGPYPLSDPNAGAAPASSNPHAFRAAGGLAFFFADDGVHGQSLWRSDGSEGGTYSLTPLCGARCARDPVPFAVGGSSYFFLATVPPASSTAQLWVSGGTPDTTLHLADVDPGPFEDKFWIPEQGLLYFEAEDRAGDHLWRTDGTPAGTFAVADVAPDFDAPLPSRMVDFNGRPYFGANDGNGPQLWTSDGSAAGTRVVANLAPGTPGALGFLSVVAGRLVFVAETPGRGAELWRSDGTPEGTVPLRELVRGPGSPAFYAFQALGDRLLFVADDGRSGQQLWSTDGTNRGTRRLTSFPAPLPFGSQFPGFYARVGQRAFFPVDDSVHGSEPWVSDGTAAGTHLVADLCPGPCSSSSFDYTAVGDRLYLFSQDAGGTSLWATDGTETGTVKIKTVCPAAGCTFAPWIFGEVGNWVLFVAAGAHGGDPQLWRTDGTLGNALRLTRLAPYSGVYLPPGEVIPGLLLFSGVDPVHGVELWRSNGRRAGTRLVKDIAADAPGTEPRALPPAP